MRSDHCHSRGDRAAITVLGPTLAPRERATPKLLAFSGRAEARDFADIYYSHNPSAGRALIEQAQTLDASFDLSVLPRS